MSEQANNQVFEDQNHIVEYFGDKVIDGFEMDHKLLGKDVRVTKGEGEDEVSVLEGTVTKVIRTSSTVYNIETMEAFPGIQFQIKNKDGSIHWTDVYPDE